MNQEKIGKLIKRIRKDNNLTQKEFADKYGVTFQAVSKWENGKNIPDIELLKQISKDYNIELNGLLEGKYVKNNNKIRHFLIIITIMFLIVLVYLFTNRNNSFTFKSLSSKCTDFDIKGVIAYNENKSSIYLSNIDYCGNNNDAEYTKIKCSLYEEGEEIGKFVYDKAKPIRLDDYLKTLDFKIDNYKETCKKYTENNLVLKIIAKDIKGNNKTYNIPLILNDNC